VTAICSTPSHIPPPGGAAGEIDLNLHSLPLRVGPSGRPWTEAMRRGSRVEMPIKAYDVYGLAEIVGPGVPRSALPETASHLPGHFYPEIVDPQTVADLARREEGELVITTLTKEAMPMIRFARATSRRASPSPALRPHDPAHAPREPADRRHVHDRG